MLVNSLILDVVFLSLAYCIRFEFMFVLFMRLVLLTLLLSVWSWSAKAARPVILRLGVFGV